MHDDNFEGWQGGHTFGQDQKRPGEARTLVVIGLTGAMMVAEVVSGLVFGSMALLADGLHMASHAVALSINAFAYVYARRHATDPRFSFGTGKVNALGGYTGAVLLVMFALAMAWESVDRLVHPVDIGFNQAILVAVLGLLVNGASVLILGLAHHDHAQQQQFDHNLKSAHLHVLADALTSVLAIVALLAAKYLGQFWMDPAMGIVGSLLVARWSVDLLRNTSGILLDKQGPESIRESIKERIEADRDSRVADLHLWCIGPGIYAAEITVVAHDPATVDAYKSRLPKHLGVEHATIEVHEYPAR